MMKIQKFFRNIAVLVFVLFTGLSSRAQLSITGTSAVTQNFDGIGSSGTAALPTGCRISNSVTDYASASAATTRAAGTSGTGILNGSAAGGLYNFANGVTASSTDRAAGFLTSSGFTSPCYLFLQIQNNTGATITALSIAFDYEKYRSGTRAFDMAFQTSSDGSSYGSVISAGGQSYGADGDNTTVYNPPTASSKTVTISSLSIAAGAYYYVRWSYTGTGGSSNAQGIGIDNISVTATLAGAGCTGTPAHATAAATPATICSGNTSALAISGHSTGTGYAYQWQSSSTGSAGSFSNISVATNTTYTSAALGATTYYRCITVCTTASTTDTSSAATVTVNTSVTPAITIAASPSGAVCSGTTVTYSSSITNGGASPAFQWKKGGATIAGATNATYAYTPANTDLLTCQLTSNATCPGPATVTSSGITMSVNALPAPTISGTTIISAGGSATLAFTGASGDIVYYWNGSSTSTTTITGGGTSSISVSPTVTTTYSVTTATSSAGCSSTVTGQYAVVTVSTFSSSDTIPTRDNNMALGNPSSATTVTSNVNNFLMIKSQFTLAYNESRGIPNWVSWHLSRAWKGPAARCDCFAQDGDLPSGYYRVSTGNYTGTGFDRGHMCPSDDRDGSDSDNTATFLMTNITPQAPWLNQQAWGNEEEYCRNLLDNGNELYIIAGNYGTGGTGSIGGTTNSFASGNVVVPAHFWKVVVVLPVGINDLSRVTANTRVFAIDMPNNQSISPDAWESYKVSVDSLESLTGYNLLSNVSTAIQAAVEAKPEVTAAGWDLTAVNSPSSVVVTSLNANMDASTASSLNTLVRGSGASVSSGTNSFRTNGFGSDGISTSNSDYYQLKLKVASGHTLSVSGVDVSFAGTSSYYATPGVTSQFAYSLNGSTFTLIGAPKTSTSLGQLNFDFSEVSALQNLNSSATVYLRYYASGQTSGGSWGLASGDTGVYALSVNGYFDQGCTGTPAGGTVSAIPASVCTGGTSTISLSGYSAGSGYGYQWQSSATGATGSFSNLSGATNTSFTTASLISRVYYRCVTTCATASTSNTSDTASVGVAATVTPSVSIAASPSGVVCSGTSVTFTATPVNGGTIPGYQWRRNSINVSGATGAAYTYAPANNDTITCAMTSTAPCPAAATVTSAAIVTGVTSSVTPSVAIAASPSGAVCAGTSVAFTATPTNGGATPAYQWRRGTVVIAGATNSTYTYSPANGDSVNCRLTSSAICPSPATAASNNLLMAVNPVVPTVSPITGTLTTYAGATTTLSSSTGGGTWASANTAVATVSAAGVVTGVSLGTVLISYTVTTACGSNYDTAVVTVATPSASGISDTAWSGMSAASATGPSIFTSLPAANTPGSSVVNVSQWNRNVVTAASGTGFYSSQNWSTRSTVDSAQAEGKYVYFTITNNASTELRLTRVNLVTQRSGTGPALAQMQYRVAGSGGDRAFGTSASVPTSAGNVAFTGSVCIAPGQTDTFKVYGWNATGSTGTFRVSNGSYINAAYVTGVTTLSVSASTNSGPVCAGTALAFTGGTASNGFSPYTYSWSGPASYSNATQSPAITSPAATASGVYTYTVTDNLGCIALNTTTATVNAAPVLTVTPVSAAICSGASTSVTASGASTYSWSPATGLSGTTGATVSSSASATQSYTISGTSAAGCTGTAVQTITVNPVPVLTVTPASAAVCTGASTSISAAGAVTYSWVPGATLSATTGATVTASPSATLSYSVTGTTAAGCSATATQVISILPAPYAGVISGATSVCTGSSATLSDTVPGGTWSSSAPGIASVNSSGSVAGITAGAATISYAVTNSCGTAFATRNINIILMQWVGGTTGYTTAWNTAANWSCGIVPDSASDVSIPSGSAYYPVIAASATNVVKSLVVASGAAITIGTGATLNIKTNLVCNGTVSGSGTLQMNGSALQTIGGAGAVQNFSLNNSAGAAVSAGSRLTISGTLSVTAGELATNDSLILYADATATARVAPLPVSGASISGNVTVMQYIPGGMRRFRFWSHPFSNYTGLYQLQNYIDITGAGGATNGFVPTASNAPSAFRYTPLTGNSSLAYDPGWKPFTSTGTTADSNRVHRCQGIRVYFRGAKNQGLGYGAYVPSAVTVAQWGTLNQGIQVVTLSKGSDSSRDYNLVGNPYASPVDIGTVAFLAKSSGNIVGAAFYVWNPSLGAAGQYQATPIGSTGAIPYYMQANTAFLVRAAHNNDTLVFTENDKHATATTALLKAEPAYIVLTVYDANYHPWDRLSIAFNDNSTDSTDSDYDATKPPGADFNFYSIAADKQRLAIDMRPFKAGDTIRLGVTGNYLQDYIIKAENITAAAGAKLYLHDKLLRQYVLLENGTEYKWAVTTDKNSQGENRFELAMEQPGRGATTTSQLSVTITPNPAQQEATVTIATNSNEPTTLKLMTLAGQTVNTQAINPANSKTIQLSLTDMPPGIYLVEVTAGGEKVQRILVKE